MINTYKEVLKRTIAKHGSAAQMGVAMEECAELIQAISKCCRYGCEGKHRENLIEEMADVTIILDELKLIHNISDIDILGKCVEKITRLEMRLDGEKCE